MIPVLGRVAALFLIFGVALYAVFGYSLMPMGALVHPDMSGGFISNSQAIYIHVFAASVAMALGPFQFSSGFRSKYPAVHRWTGRIYLLIGVLVGGASGLYIAQHAFGGVVSVWGFSLLAMLWLLPDCVPMYPFVRETTRNTESGW